MRLRRIIPALFLFAATQAHAGAWTQPRGDGLFITQGIYYSTSSFFDETGRKVKQPTFRKYELQPYVEYGLRDWLTLGGTAYLDAVAQSGDSNQGLADPQLFLRARLHRFDDGDVLSIQPLVKFQSLYAKGGTPRSGSRSNDFELSLLYGHNWELWGFHGYQDSSVGYRIRSGLNAQYHFDQSLGIYVTDNFLLIPAARGVIAAKYDDNASFREDGDQDYDLAKVELTAMYKFAPQQWIHVTAFDHVAGAFTGGGRGIIAGFAEPF